MTLDIKTLGALIKANQSLVGDIRGAVLDIDQAAKALDRARQQTAAAIQIGADGRLQVGFGDKTAQLAIMAKIVELQAQIAENTDPILGADLRVELADEFVNLANSTNAVISSFVTFTAAEAAQIAELIREATLDTQQRKAMASLLQGAISLLEAGLKVAALVTV
ncbi:MAG TPA: hypothetical protein VER11_20875 [Polyangiaceae bacterium]|jgi:hypothetical protein|nr:hypothetical protein [Polyangiaceae bacterium]